MAYLVLFDGVCNFCNNSINFIIDRDSKAQFEFASLQSEIGQNALKQYGFSTEKLESVVLIMNGKAYQKSRAALEIVLHFYHCTIFYSRCGL